MTKHASYSQTLTIRATPAAVFEAICDVRSWWSGRIDGRADRLGAEFRYRYRALHDSSQRVTAFEPGRRVVWRVLDAQLSFVDDPGEWKDTEIVFELAPQGEGSSLVFTHVGLNPQCACYEACSGGWRALLSENLVRRSESGQPQPDAFA